MEREPVKIDAGKNELKILKAVFGKFKPETKGVPKHYPTFDVTGKINEKLMSGITEIPVNNKLIDGQKPEGNKTALRITYSTDGEERTVYVPEGKKLNLSTEYPEPKLVAENGEIYWKTPYPGKITCNTSSGKTKSVEVKSVPEPINLNGQWEVSFNENSTTTFDKLYSWSASEDDEIKYFSGTAAYRKEFVISENLLIPENYFELDLGNVRVMAEVMVNGKNLGIFWKAPFRINLDGVLKSGINTLEVRITNLWPNRLIGDEHLPLDYERKGVGIDKWPDWLLNKTERPTKRTTFASYVHWEKNSELLTSGLLGPVKIVVSKATKIEL
jgi:hypothetical protein